MQPFTLLKLISLTIAAHSLTATTHAPANSIPANSIQVGIDRWLHVRHTTGQVFYHHGSTSKPISIGTKLQAVGDTIRTEARSSGLLDVDTGIGFIKVAEKTTLQIKELKTLPNGGRVTRLEVTGGQARLQLRPFTHQFSRLEVVTPAGVSGVRGTEFGVMAQPSGKTGVATLSGSVVTTAQGRSVLIDGGFQSLTMPGEAPLPVTPLKDDPALDIDQLTLISSRQAVFKGQTDAVNFLLVNNVPQSTDRNGRFEVIAQVIDNQVKATVITPLGKRQDYSFTRPR